MAKKKKMTTVLKPCSCNHYKLRVCFCSVSMAKKKKKSIATLKPCDHKRSKDRDRVNELPKDILLSILEMASLSMKEVARLSLVSHRWESLWKCFPIIKFEDLIGDKLTVEIFYRHRSKFVTRVNHVMDTYLGSTIHTLRIAFDLDNTCQPHIDKWVAFAFTKHVKTLDLDLTPVFIIDPVDLCRPELPLNWGSVMPSLSSLSLKYVKVAAQGIECLLHSCPLLESLSIEASQSLTRIRSSSSTALQLKYLSVSFCWSLKAIDISAPKLLSFRYDGCPVELHIRNACFLSEVCIGGWRADDSILYAFDSLSKYFSQLEHLSLIMRVADDEVNKGISHLPVLTNLKHLELAVIAPSHQTVLGWTPLIHASPVLQKLTIKLDTFDSYCDRAVVKFKGCPLRCLNTLEIVGFVGLTLDLELIAYVVENAPTLEQVILILRNPDCIMVSGDRPLDEYALSRASKLVRELSQRLRVIIKQ